MGHGARADDSAARSAPEAGLSQQGEIALPAVQPWISRRGGSPALDPERHLLEGPDVDPAAIRDLQARGSVLKVEMSAYLRALTYIKIKRYGLHVRAYLHI